MSRVNLLLLSTKAVLLDLADNNKRRWSHFTGDMPCTLHRFRKRLIELKITRNPDEADLVWQAFDVKGSEMQFREFIQFLQNDSIGEKPIEDKVSVASLLYKKRRELIEYCLAIDTTVSGVISHNHLVDFARDNGIISNANELSAIVSEIDKGGTGKINYFKFMYKLSQLGEDNFEIRCRDSSDALSLSPSGSSLDGLYSRKSPVRESGGRAALDPSIFGDKSPSSTESRGGARNQLDPAIFGEKTEGSVVQAAPTAKVDIANSRDCTDFNSDQTISVIARIANSKFRSLRDCFTCWRGQSDRLTWEDIYAGMVNDAKMEVSPEILEALVQQYGGELTVSSFTRFISDGARINAPEPVKEAPPPLTERDVLWNKIANGLKDKQWETVIKASKNALDLSRNLKKLGVTVKSDELRRDFEEMGIKKIIEEIKKRQIPPKKRRGT